MEVNYPRVVLAGLAIALVLGLGVAASTSGATLGTYNSEWDGASDLREVGTDAGADVKIVRTLGNDSGYTIADPNDTVAVVLSPDRPYTATEASRIRAFVEEGGTLLVAEDVGPRGNDLLASVGATARVDGGLLRDERNNFRAPALPIAGNVSEHNLTDGVEELTLNYGTPVEPGNATTLVGTSEFAYVDRNRNGELDDDETLRSYPVATVEPVGNGRVIAVGDPSLLINAMVEREGNRAFAENTLGSHDRVLLDYSHTADIPPIRVALLILGETPSLQVLVGTLGVGVIALWVRGDTRRLRGRVKAAAARAGVPGFDNPPTRRDDESGPGLSRAELRTYLTEHHPEWEEDRIERVIGGVLGAENESTDQ